MTVLQWLLWILVGALTAFAFLKTQSWSVRMITPEKPKLSAGLVIGGAIFRWISDLYCVGVGTSSIPVRSVCLIRQFYDRPSGILILIRNAFQACGHPH